MGVSWIWIKLICPASLQLRCVQYRSSTPEFPGMSGESAVGISERRSSLQEADMAQAHTGPQRVYFTAPTPAKFASISAALS
jgi:hypothetical protein